MTLHSKKSVNMYQKMIVQLFNMVILALMLLVMYIIYRALLRLRDSIKEVRDEQALVRAEIRANKKILGTVYSNFLAVGNNTSQ